MRNLLLLLLLANILFFIWGRATEQPGDTGATVIDVSEFGPPLELADARTARRAGSRPQSDRSSSLSGVTGRACVSIGPFANGAEAERVLQDYEREGMWGAVRSTEGELFVGHWVQIRNIPNREVGDAMLKRLVAGGLSDAYLLPPDEAGLTISLGLFGDIGRAERVELQAESLNLPAETTARMRDATVFFADIALPPGRGASAMVERHGEEKVLLREEASCPASG
ncbi:MAG TPA: SPOR domain-containing protein [Woeseiaceae bacterium]|nr:SPOR domain-containing protein [Woeseiaceae bacterium]